MDDEFPSASDRDGPEIRAAFSGSRIDVVEDSRSRLVLFIPPGGKSGLGCFAIMWNGILSIITLGFLFATLQPDGPPWPVFLFLSLFWAVGLGVAYFWLKSKYERMMLLVEPSHAVLRRTLFGRTKTQEIDLGPESSASLYEAYSVNDVPVHGVDLRGLNDGLRFGSGLPDADKKWLRTRLNEFLGAEADEDDADIEDFETVAAGPVEFPERCVQYGASLGSRGDVADIEELPCQFCGHVHRGRRAFSVKRSELREDAPPEGPFPPQIRIAERSPQRLEYNCWIVDSLPVRLALGGFLGFFATSWNGGVWTFVIAVAQAPGFFKIFAMLFAIPFILVGLAVAVGAAMVIFGRLRVTLDQAELRARWGLGPFGWSRSLPTAAIDRISIQDREIEASESSSPRKLRRAKNGSGGPDQLTCFVWAGQQKIGVLGTYNTNVARHVAQLLREQLLDMGIRLDNRRAPAAAPDVNAD
ncbi:MAG: hypothetical protein KF774_04740 [Planctomyces sp.]|nr:hypothetical protein [Planctomyces sp.]